MDMKFKIIIVIFVAIAFMYIGHFIINYMGGKTKQESVTEEFNDVEHYEEPAPPEPKNIASTTSSATSSASTSPMKYDQRILILDDIEKLDIPNKEIKGKLMEKLFDDSVLKDISEMSASERSAFIKEKLAELIPKPKKEVDSEKLPGLTEPKKTEQLDFDPSSLVTKTQETIKSLQSVQDGLKEIHRIAESFKSPSASAVKTQKENSLFKEPYIPPTSLIEGFENMRSYAPLF